MKVCVCFRSSVIRLLSVSTRMAEDLVEEWRKFSLTEDEAPGFTVDGDAMGNAKVLGSHCLLGKLITDKYFNKEALKSSMLRLWGLACGITIQTIGANLFVFQFKDEFERERVLQGTPWLFDNHLLALNVFDGSGPAQQVRFTHSCFWVQLHGVPMIYMTKETGERVGNAIGTTLEVAVPESGVGWGPSLRVRIRLDITKPFPRGRLITFQSLGQMWVSFKYERLPWFCFHCGLLGHSQRDCVARLRAGLQMEESHVQYGPWLRATGSSQRRRRSTGDRVVGTPPGMTAKTTVHAGNFGNRSAQLSDGNTIISNSNSKVTESSDSGGVVPKSSQQHGDMGDCVRESLKPPKVPGSTKPRNKSIAKDWGTDKPASLDKDGSVDVVPPSSGSGGLSGSHVAMDSKCTTHGPQVLHEVDILHGKYVSPGVVEVGSYSCPLEFHPGSLDQDGAHKGQSSRSSTIKKSWKRLARAKGRDSPLIVEGPKRGSYSSPLFQAEPEKKRSKVSDGICKSISSLSAEAMVQPRRDQ